MYQVQILENATSFVRGLTIGLAGGAVCPKAYWRNRRWYGRVAIAGGLELLSQVSLAVYRGNGEAIYGAPGGIAGLLVGLKVGEILNRTITKTVRSEVKED